MKKIEKFLPYIKGSKKLSIFALGCAFLSTGSKLAIPLLAGKAVNLMIVGSVDFQEIGRYIIYMSILLITGTVFRYIFDYLTALIGQNVVKNMRGRLYDSYLADPISYIDSSRQGDLLLRLTNDVENVQNGLISGGAALFDGVVAILFTIGFMFSINWALTLLVIFLTPLSILVSHFVSRFNSKHFTGQAKASGSMNGFVQENLVNSEAVKTLNITSEREKEFTKLDNSFRNEVFKANFGASIINPSTRLVNNLINACLILLGAFFIVRNVNLGIAFLVGDLSAFLVYSASYMQPFNEISDVISEINYAIASFKRIDEAVNSKKDEDGTVALDSPIEEIKAEHVNFSYDKKRIIINDFSLSAMKGKKIAFVGPTGCGKTTVINLLLRFYDPDEGKILFNDTPSIDAKKDSLRSHLGMVLQETWVFKGTVYENIAYAKPNASKEEVIEAAKKAEADSFIRRLPNGYDTLISDSSGLSLGEKQLLCVARVMLLSPEVVILDEATSSIDIRTESLLSKSFDTLMKGKTSFVVAHRLSTIVSSDLIVVLKDGKIIEQGNHRELLAKKGFYYDLYNSQFAS